MQSKNSLGRSPEQNRSTSSSGSRRRAGLAVGALAAALTSSALVGAPGASAAPLAGHVTTIFPDRDFVSVEGYTPGDIIAFKVLRAGAPVGVGSAEVGLDGIAEVNHPGGGCWSTQPDILPGDVISVKAPGVAEEKTTTQNMFVTANAQQVGTTVTVGGFIGAGVSRTDVEQRIVDPRFTNLIGRRDIRAIPGARTLSKVTSGKTTRYFSQLTFPDADTFKATYEFTGPNAAAVASAAKVAATASLGERALSWDDATLRGLTIAEYGEIGGKIPDCGGTTATPLPTGIESIRVTWKPGELRVRGATPGVGQTVTVFKGDSTTGTRLGSCVTVAAVDGHVGGDFDCRITQNVTTNPQELWLTATGGGLPSLKEGPIVVVG
jgi:hypothetical protein